jgi:hypothetical protein
VRLQRQGLATDLPRGWDGRIYQRAGDQAGGTTQQILHAGNFALPVERGDYGSGAVEVMRGGDVFVALLEFDREAAGTPLFAREGFPSQVSASSFSPNRLQRALPGQGGCQFFFTSQGRAYCLYVVLGSYANRERLVAQVNRLLASITVSPREGSR